MYDSDVEDGKGKSITLFIWLDWLKNKCSAKMLDLRSAKVSVYERCDWRYGCVKCLVTRYYGWLLTLWQTPLKGIWVEFSLQSSVSGYYFVIGEPKS